MSNTIVLSTADWAKLRDEIVRRHTIRVLLTTDRFKEVFGVTKRELRYAAMAEEYRQYVCLDFINEKWKSKFILTYSEFLLNKKDLGFSKKLEKFKRES